MSGEKFQPEHEWDSRTAESEGKRFWDLFILGKLVSNIFSRSDERGTVLVDDRTGHVIVDDDGDATGL